MSTIQLSTKGIDGLIAALKGPQPVARVGILGGKVSRVEQKSTLTMAEVQALQKPIRQGKHLNNAEIGAIHEFGDATHPVRSFLRGPLSDRMQREMEEAGAFTRAAMAEVLRRKSLRPWIAKVAILAEKVVLGAFATDGYGKWAAWKSGYTSKTGNILVDTTQLRNSITSQVVDK